MSSFLPIPPDHDFPLQNLPFGVFSKTKEGRSSRHIGVAIGDYVLDLTELSTTGCISDPELLASSCFKQDTLNVFMGLGMHAWNNVRSLLSRLLSSAEGELRDNSSLQELLLIPQSEVQMHLPARIGDYTDFYASKQHATNVGVMFRGKDNALQPNWLHLPVGYHGRASSIVVSGQDVKRPRGQILEPGTSSPILAPSRAVDYELEMACLIGPGNQQGSSIAVGAAKNHIFGVVLMNDWSARDIQKWEYVPLGPFNGKNWATCISPWVVTLEALEPFRVAAPPQEPTVLPYLQSSTHSTYDVQLSVDITPAGSTTATTVARSNLRHLYWSFPQMIAHHTVGGCNLQPGDLLGTGTISGDTDEELGSLLELTLNGTRPFMLPTGESRTFLQDGDTVTMRGHCQGQGYRIGFGECRSTLLPSL